MCFCLWIPGSACVRVCALHASRSIVFAVAVWYCRREEDAILTPFIRPSLALHNSMKPLVDANILVVYACIIPGMRQHTEPEQAACWAGPSIHTHKLSHRQARCRASTSAQPRSPLAANSTKSLPKCSRPYETAFLPPFSPPTRCWHLSPFPPLRPLRRMLFIKEASRNGLKKRQSEHKGQ